jgi:DNA polymerase V
MARGGKREGAGRRRKEPTVVARIPESKIDFVKSIIKGEYKVPLYQSKVQAGFPSPADDYIEDVLDLNEYLIKHPAATFMVRATGESMTGAGIHPNNILIVDRSINATHGQIVIAAIDGELTVKRLYQKEGVIKLQPENPSFQDIRITSDNDMVIWGVVTKCIVEFS